MQESLGNLARRVQKKEELSTPAQLNGAASDSNQGMISDLISTLSKTKRQTLYDRFKRAVMLMQLVSLVES